MDQMKSIRRVPRFFGIADVELEVRWDISGLDEREVDASDVGQGIIVCTIQGPRAAFGADIEDSTGLRSGMRNNLLSRVKHKLW